MQRLDIGFDNEVTVSNAALRVPAERRTTVELAAVRAILARSMLGRRLLDRLDRMKPSVDVRFERLAETTIVADPNAPAILLVEDNRVEVALALAFRIEELWLWKTGLLPDANTSTEASFVGGCICAQAVLWGLEVRIRRELTGSRLAVPPSALPRPIEREHRRVFDLAFHEARRNGASVGGAMGIAMRTGALRIRELILEKTVRAAGGETYAHYYARVYRSARAEQTLLTEIEPARTHILDLGPRGGTALARES
jgi:hypothetical protein